jgi:hypothetical protein
VAEGLIWTPIHPSVTHDYLRIADAGQVVSNYRRSADPQSATILPLPGRQVAALILAT